MITGYEANPPSVTSDGDDPGMWGGVDMTAVFVIIIAVFVVSIIANWWEGRHDR